MGVFITAYIIQYNYYGTIEEASGASFADLIIVIILYKITMRVKQYYKNKLKPKSRCAV